MVRSTFEKESAYKSAGIYYRGMGHAFVPKVLSEGLNPGHSITTSLDVAREYAGKGAANIEAGDTSHGAAPIGPIKKLQRIGFPAQEASLRSPYNIPANGVILKLDLPEAIEQKSLRAGLPYLAESVTREKLPAQHIQVMKETGKLDTAGRWQARARRLTNEQVRLLEATRKRGLTDDAIKLVRDANTSFAMNLGQRLRQTRQNRHLLTSSLKSLLKKAAVANELLELHHPQLKHALLDELVKLGAVSDAHAQHALERLDSLERNKPTAGQLGRYGAIGAVAAPAIGAIGNVVRGRSPFEGANRVGKLRDAASMAVRGGLSASVIPLARVHSDRKAEVGTLRRYMKERDNAGVASQQG